MIDTITFTFIKKIASQFKYLPADCVLIKKDNKTVGYITEDGGRFHAYLGDKYMTGKNTLDECINEFILEYDFNYNKGSVIIDTVNNTRYRKPKKEIIIIKQ